MSEFLLLLLFGYVVYLHTKISDITRQIKHSSVHDGTQPATAAQQSAGTPLVTQISLKTNSAVPLKDVRTTVQPDQQNNLWRWIATDWPMKLGALLVMLGVGWFVSYAFAQNWIGPVGRISLGLVFGTAVLLAGYVRAKHEAHQGTVIMVLGAAAVLITTYAAREVYDFFTPTTALLLMASVAAFISFSSVTDRVKSRSLIGLLVGCIAPFLTVSADPSVAGLFGYIFVLLAASIWIVAITGWKELLVAAVGVYAVFSTVTLMGATIGVSEKPTMIVLVTAFVVMFYGVGVICALKSKHVATADVFVKILSSLIFVFWVHALIEPYMQPYVMIIASLLTALAAWGLLLQTANKWLVVLHGAFALVYLAIAVSFKLEGATALFAYIALTTVGAWLAGLISKNFKTGQLFGLPYILLFFAALESVSYAPTWSELLILATLTTAMGSLGFYWYTNLSNLPQGYSKPIPEFITVYLYAALITAVLFWWLVCEKIISSQDTAHGLALVSYTLAGVALYGYGQLQRLNKTKIAGGVLLGGVIIRLLTVEVWDMVLAARVVVFILIGGLLMGVAFLRPNKGANE